jgi:hypothetical protein
MMMRKLKKNIKEIFISTSFNGSNGSDAFTVHMFNVCSYTVYNGQFTIKYN